MNPYKQAARSGFTIDEVINGPKQCIGHFYDTVNKRTVNINLGVVVCTFLRLYKAASSTASTLEVVKPFEGDGAALCLERTMFLFAGVPDLVENGVFIPTNLLGQKSPGTYVIPGQSVPREANAQKIVNKSLFEWSLERCAAELC